MIRCEPGMRRVCAAALLWCVAAVGTATVLLPLIIVLVSPVEMLLSGDPAGIVRLPAVWFLLLLSTGFFTIVLGVPIAAVVVLGWSVLARYYQRVERSVSGIVMGSGALGLCGMVVAHLLFRLKDPNASSAQHLAGALVTGLAIWGGFALPRLLWKSLGPGRMLHLPTGSNR